MRRLVTLCGFLLLCGCKSHCRALTEKLCDCSLNTNEKTSCLQRAGSAENSNPPTPDDEVVCERLYEDCDCQLIKTPEGKVKCGMAREP